MSIPTLDDPRIQAFRAECAAALPDIDTEAPLRVKRFTANPEAAALLLRLVRDRVKTSTASMPWEFVDRPDDRPQEGMYWIVVDAEGNPGAFCRLYYVKEMPFHEIGPDHSALEGEAVRPIDKWKEMHWNFWAKMAETHPHGKPVSEDMPVICQRFEVLYPV